MKRAIIHRSRGLLAMLLLAGLVLASFLALQSFPQTVAAAAGWQTQSAPSGLPADCDGLADVWGTSPSNVYSVTLCGVLIHYDGSQWVSQGRIPMDSPDGVEPYISDLWGTSSDLFVLGGVNWHEHSIFRRSGGRWTQENIDNHDGSYSGIWGTSSRDVFAVGGCDIGIINHYDGASWNAQLDPDEGTIYLTDVWGSSGSNVYAVGCGESYDPDTYEYNSYGSILHFDGTGWSTMTQVAGTGLSAVWGSSAANVFAVGGDGAIVHYNGTSWSAMSSGTTSDLYGVWGSSGSNVFAVGSNGAIVHYNGTSWSAMSSGTSSGLYGVWGSGSEVFAVGADGTILHYGTISSPPAAGNQAPGAPANLSPANGATGIVPTPVLQASAFSDLDGDSHAASSWQVRSAGGSYSSPVWQGTSAGPATAITVPAGELKHLKKYYWRVSYQDGHGLWSAYSAETSFTTADFVYADRPVNITPAGGATGVSLTPVLQASAYYHREGYPHTACSWQVRSASGSYDKPVWESGLSSRPATSITVPAGELRGSTKYYWRVGYKDSRGLWSAYSKETSFTTAYVPGDTDHGSDGSQTTPVIIPDETTDTTPYVTPDETTDSTPEVTPDGTHAAPVVATGGAVSVTQSSAQLVGELQSLGGAGSVAVSFVWGTRPGGPYTNATAAVTRNAAGSFQADLTGLAPGTVFYYQARAVGDSTVYGAEKSFTTASSAGATVPAAAPAGGTTAEPAGSQVNLWAYVVAGVAGLLILGIIGYSANALLRRPAR